VYIYNIVYIYIIYIIFIFFLPLNFNLQEKIRPRLPENSCSAMDAALAPVYLRIVPGGSGDRPGPVVASLGGGDRWGWLGVLGLVGAGKTW
jgi:hypothetical protein